MSTITTRILYEHKLPSGVVISAVGNKDLDANTKLAKNFVLSELANNKATDNVKAILNNNVDLHIEMMQMLRTRLARSVDVTSWYRTEAFNKKIGGSANSLHLKALATDCWFAEKDPKNKNKWLPMTDSMYKKIETLWKQICYEKGVIGGINRYTHGVHLSSREDMLGYKQFVIRDCRGKAGDW